MNRPSSCVHCGHHVLPRGGHSWGAAGVAPGPASAPALAFLFSASASSLHVKYWLELFPLLQKCRFFQKLLGASAAFQSASTRQLLLPGTQLRLQTSARQVAKGSMKICASYGDTHALTSSSTLASRFGHNGMQRAKQKDLVTVSSHGESSCTAKRPLSAAMGVGGQDRAEGRSAVAQGRGVRSCPWGSPIWQDSPPPLEFGFGCGG